ERVFGIYATYVLYYGQASDYQAKIHVTSNDLKILLEFLESTLIPLRHLDAVACVHKLVQDDAFAIVPFDNDFDPATQKKVEKTAKPLKEDQEELKYVPLEVTKSLMEDPVFKTMIRVQKQMGELEKGFGDHKLDITEKNSSFIDRIQNIVVELAKELTHIDDKKNSPASKPEAVIKSETADEERTVTSRSLLRRKAFNSTVTLLRQRRYGEQANNVIIKTECSDSEVDAEQQTVKEEPHEDCRNENMQKRRARKPKLHTEQDTSAEKACTKFRNRPKRDEQAIEEPESDSTKKNPENFRDDERFDGLNEFSNAILQLDISSSDIKPAEPKLDADFEIEMSRAEATLSHSYEKKILKLEQL
ncbi:hypothetical protein GCK32_010601, partial [Trichostrongylus colubriformis]